MTCGKSRKVNRTLKCLLTIKPCTSQGPNGEGFCPKKAYYSSSPLADMYLGPVYARHCVKPVLREQKTQIDAHLSTAIREMKKKVNTAPERMKGMDGGERILNCIWEPERVCLEVPLLLSKERQEGRVSREGRGGDAFGGSAMTGLWEQGGQRRREGDEYIREKENVVCSIPGTMICTHIFHRQHHP